MVLGEYKETKGEFWHKHIKKHETGNEKWLRGTFNLIVEKYVIILLLYFIEKQFLMSCLKVFTFLLDIILAERLFYVFGPR